MGGGGGLKGWFRVGSRLGVWWVGVRLVQAVGAWFRGKVGVLVGWCCGVGFSGVVQGWFVGGCWWVNI